MHCQVRKTNYSAVIEILDDARAKLAMRADATTAGVNTSGLAFDDDKVAQAVSYVGAMGRAVCIKEALTSAM